jgi:phytoene desaturase
LRIMRKTVVIGAGIGGLATAIRLARMGYEVDVFESAPTPGGKLAEVRGNGFRFDAGPSLFTLPELAIELLDKDLQFDIKRLPVITRYFWSDGLQIDAYSDVEELCREAETKTGIAGKIFKKYLAETGEIYRITAPVFIFNSLHKIKSLFNKSNIPALWGLTKLKAFTSLHDFNKKKLKNERIVQLLDRYATYNGSNPYQTPATLRVIAHLEHNLGAWLPEGGMYTIVKSLVRQAERLGVRFHFNEAVENLEVENGKVAGVKTISGFYPADIAVSNIDIYRFYAHLLPNKKKLQKLDRQQRSSSAIIFYWGIKGNFPQLDVHNIFFSDRYREEFDDLFNRFSIIDDPTVYVYISSKIFPDDAPEQCENWFVMVNAPENVGQNWEELEKKTRQNILEKLRNALGVNMEEKIVFEEVLNPEKIEEKTGSWHGSLYGPSSNNLMSAFQRHPNFSSKVKGLYFTGGSVHPGGGIPLCISSAKIVATLIENEYR